MNKITKCSICTMVMQALFYSEKCMMNPVDAVIPFRVPTRPLRPPFWATSGSAHPIDVVHPPLFDDELPRKDISFCLELQDVVADRPLVHFQPTHIKPNRLTNSDLTRLAICRLVALSLFSPLAKSTYVRSHKIVPPRNTLVSAVTRNAGPSCTRSQDNRKHAIR